MIKGRRKHASLASAGVCLTALFTSCAPLPSDTAANNSSNIQRCETLAERAVVDVPVDGLVISGRRWVAAGSTVNTREGASDPLPGHCLIEGHFPERPGLIGGPYAIGFQMRLPAEWNGRFFFQGGGGSNCVVNDAIGPNGQGNPLALTHGYAVIAQDSGHDNTRNNVPDHGGELVFSHDPQARRDYGHSSLKPVYDLGEHLIATFYGRARDKEIFWGCSKGGQEGMAFAQRYPDAFDGIVAMAPGISLPHAAVAQAWDTQVLAGILRARGEPVAVDNYRSLFSPGQASLKATSAPARMISSTMPWW